MENLVYILILVKVVLVHLVLGSTLFWELPETRTRTLDAVSGMLF